MATIRSVVAEYLTFIAATGDQESSIEMRYADENIWLTQKMMAMLYDVEVPTINAHMKKIVEYSELTEDAMIRKTSNSSTGGRTPGQPSGKSLLKVLVVKEVPVCTQMTITKFWNE